MSLNYYPHLPTPPDYVLYRMFNQHGELVYVGMTKNPRSRIGNHKDGKWWWRTIATITLERFASQEELCAAELREIALHQPKYNVANNPGYRGTARDCVRENHPGADGHKLCEVCDEAIWTAKHYLEEEEAEEQLLKLLLAPAPAPVKEATA